VRRADHGRNDAVLCGLPSHCSRLGLWNVKVPNRVRNERLPWALSLRGVAQAGHVAWSVEQGGDWLLEDGVLEGTEAVFGLSQSQPEMLEALVVLVEGKDLGDGFFLTVIVTDDAWQFDAHSRASPGSSGR
jgi:hypothetical protein